jgi:hypothetical protein
MSMCECDELDFEDFQVMLAAISKARPAEQAPLEAPLIRAAARKRVQ